MARPENFIRLTMNVFDPHRLIAAMAVLRQWWRRYVGPWEDVYAIEANPARTGLHLHGWQYGTPVDQGDLARAAEVAGFLGETYGEQRRLPTGDQLTYFLKEAIYQPALTMPASAELYLELNNTLVHTTRGFWRDSDGQPIPTMRKAVQLARRKPTASGDWVVTTIDPPR